MNRLRILGLALVAVFAMSAVAVSSASAVLPEFAKSGVCEKGAVKKYHYTENKCVTVSAGNVGEFGFSPFTSTSKEGLLETEKGEKIKCTSDENWGELTGPKTDRVRVVFKGCTGPLGEKCTSTVEPAPAKSGEIILRELESKLGYINKATKEVGIALSPVGGGALTEFVCETILGNETVKVTGSVIGVITKVNVMAKTFTLTFSQEKGKQKPIKLEGEPEDVLIVEGKGVKPFGPEKGGEATVDTLTMVAENEIKA